MSSWIHTLPFLSAFLFWASFHPLNLGVLGWISLVPLLVYARRSRGTKSFLVAWLAGAAAFGAGFAWVRHTVPVGPFLLGAYKGIYVACFVLLVRRLGTLWAPPLWVALEYLRGTLFGGLPWFLLGYTQHAALRLIQIADVGGVWLLSGLVAFVNAALVDGRRAARWSAAGALATAFVYGAVRLGTVPLSEGPRIAVIQPNIPQDLKLLMDLREPQKEEIFRRHRDLTLRAAEQSPDLMVWPEAALYDGLFWDVGAGTWIRERWYGRLGEAARRAGAPLLTGMLVVELERGGRRRGFTNSAVLVDRAGEIRDRYDKVRLVPFAEFVPLAGTFPWMRDLVEKYSGLRLSDMRAGREFPSWEIAGSRFGVQICFEAVFPEISRAIARNGARFTVNISNDGWFRDSAELDQVLVMARFRAVENRIGFVRATNTGISAFIDPAGRIHAAIEGKEVEGILVERGREGGGGGLWRAWGAWVAWLAAGAAVGGIVVRFFVDRRRKDA